ncbi:MAG TPA: DUF3943 domain-containing protein [Mucilaginibacter sp.]
MSKYLLCFICLLFFEVIFISSTGWAQTPFDNKRILNDSLHKKAPPDKPLVENGVAKKNFGRAALLFAGAEVVPWTFDHYIFKYDYANISFATIKHNLKLSSWTWDNDEFQTNQFGHPYQGSQFFSAFRANGYSFWQSAPASFAGSYIWESTAENQSPAPNDFINTGLGGAVLGEMTYRLSRRIVNNRTRGFKRQMSEVLGFIINPMNGLTRLMDGRWGRVSDNPAEQDTSKVSLEIDLGGRDFKATRTNGLKSNGYGWYGRIKLLYGSRYEDYKTPFSNIYINAEFGQDDSSKMNYLNVYGSLAGWELAGDEKKEQLAILSANYDYIHNEAFLYGGQSLKMNLFSEYNLSRKLSFNTSLGVGPVILAAVTDRYPTHGRFYDYTTGTSFNGGVGVSLLKKLLISLDYNGAWLVTVNGSASHYFLHTVTSEIQYMLTKQFSFAVQPGYFTLHGKYNDHPTVDNKYPFVRLSARYSFNL